MSNSTPNRVCSKCGGTKFTNESRPWKRRVCIACERARMKTRADKMRNDPEFREKMREPARARERARYRKERELVGAIVSLSATLQADLHSALIEHASNKNDETLLEIIRKFWQPIK